MESRAGQLLIASPKLLDPNFARTVTLIVEHGESGALGLVLNRRTETRMNEAWEQVSDAPCEHRGWVYRGGPCEGPLMAVHTHSERSQFEPLPGVHVTADREDLEWLMAADAGPMRCFVGYAGWGAGQLEVEVETSSWLLVRADETEVFDRAAEGQWAALLRRVDPAQAALALNPRIVPSDPSHN